MSGRIPQRSRRDAKGRVLRTGDRSVRLQVKFHDQMSAGRQTVRKVPDQVDIDVVDDDDQFKRARHPVTAIEIAPYPLRA